MGLQLPLERRKRLFAVGVSALAMGWMEAIVVVYIRKMIGLEGNLDAMDPGTQQAVLERFSLMRSQGPDGFVSPAFLWIEQSREVATILMLAAIAWLSGLNTRQRIAYFFFCFGLWDLVYYAALWLLLRWPPSLSTVDILFLIPQPWIANMWIPAAISCVFIAGSIWSLLIPGRGGAARKRKTRSRR